MNRIAVCFAAAMGVFALRAEVVTNVWIGAQNSSLEWNSAANWSQGHNPTASEHILITNTTAQAITTSTYGMRIARLTVSGANHSLNATGLYYDAYTGEDKDSLPAGTIIEVASGKTLTLNSGGRTSGDDKCVLNKIGAGVLSNYGGLGGGSPYYRYKAVNVYEGSIETVINRSVIASRINIYNGAKFRITSNDRLSSVCEVYVEEGGTFNVDATETIARLYGEGSVTGTGTLTLKLADGPCGFAGTINPSLVLAPNPYVAGETEFICSNANTLVKTPISASGAELTDMLKVAKDLGRVPVAIDNATYAGLKYTDGEPVVFSRYIASGRTYSHVFDGDDHWTEPVFGEGTIVEKSTGTWTIDSLNLTGGTFQVSADATGPGIVITGGACSNATLTMSKYGNYDYSLGVSWKKFSEFNLGDRIFRQTAGTNSANQLKMGTQSGETLNEIGFFIEGGRFTSDGSEYGMGLGLEASGDAEVVLGGSGNDGGHSIVYQKDGHDHTLRVKDNAIVRVPGNLSMMYYKGSASTATVEIVDNGLLTVSGFFGNPGNRVPESGFVGRVFFDGGTFQSDRMRDSVDVPVYPNNFADKDFQTYVKEGGMKIDVPRAYRDKTLNWYKPVSTAEGTVNDGGISVTGGGTLALNGAVSLNGPISVDNATIGGAASGNRFLGAGSSYNLNWGKVINENYELKEYEMIPGVSPSITYAGNSGIGFKAFTSGMTTNFIGNASSPLSLVRGERGFLCFERLGGPNSATVPANYKSDLFNWARVYIKGDTSALLNSCGVFAQPVVGRLWGPGSFSWGYNRGQTTVRLLTVRPETGLLWVPSYAYTNSLPAAATAATAAFISNSKVTVNGDRTVGALDILGNGLQINSGCTVTVGEGAGKVATIALSNLHLNTATEDSDSGTISGAGTLDFGAAEGVFALNNVQGGFGQRISAKLAGTGGITFYSPFTQFQVTESSPVASIVRVSGANTYSGGTYVNNTVLQVESETACGTGTVTVEASGSIGGAIVFAPEFEGVFANDIRLAGYGYCIGNRGSWGAASTNRYAIGASLGARGNAVLTGTVELATDTAIRVEAGAAVRFTKAFTGTGALKVLGGGEITVAAVPENVDWGEAQVTLRTSGASEIAHGSLPANAKLFIDGDGEGGSGCVVVDGDLDLGAMTLELGSKAGFVGEEFEILRVTNGTLAGDFANVKLPNSRWSLQKRGNSLHAVHEKLGTLLFVR